MDRENIDNTEGAGDLDVAYSTTEQRVIDSNTSNAPGMPSNATSDTHRPCNLAAQKQGFRRVFSQLVRPQQLQALPAVTQLKHQQRTQNLPADTASQRKPAHTPKKDPSRQPDSLRLYLREVASCPRLIYQEEYDMVIRMRAGDTQAHDALIQANLGLVVMLARRYQRPNAPLLDLVAEGNFGLLTAIKRFNPELGYRFSTYAKWWVMKAILEAIPKLVNVVELPAYDQANRKNRSTPPDADKDTAISFTPDSDAVLSSSHNDNATWPSYAKEASDQATLDTMAIPAEQEPPQAIMVDQKAAALQCALQSLSDREQIIIGKRFALHSDQEHVCTLDELSRELGVSKERIRQIESAALAKMKRFLNQSGIQEAD